VRLKTDPASVTRIFTNGLPKTAGRGSLRLTHNDRHQPQEPAGEARW